MNQENKVIKICVAASAKDVNAEIDSRFGRCGYFVFFTVQDKKTLLSALVV